MVGKVATLRTRTGKSTTAIVVEAINRYHAVLERQGGDPAEILGRTGFLASATGPKQLSRRYKAHLAGLLRRKT